MNTRIKGRWHCSFCKRDILLASPTGRWDTKYGRTCPHCGNNSVNWILGAARTPVTPTPLAIIKLEVTFDPSKLLLREDPENVINPRTVAELAVMMRDDLSARLEKINATVKIIP